MKRPKSTSNAKQLAQMNFIPEIFGPVKHGDVETLTQMLNDADANSQRGDLFFHWTPEGYYFQLGRYKYDPKHPIVKGNRCWEYRAFKTIPFSIVNKKIAYAEEKGFHQMLVFAVEDNRALVIGKRFKAKGGCHGETC